MNKRHYEHTLPNIRGSLSNTYRSIPYLHIQRAIRMSIPVAPPSSRYGHHTFRQVFREGLPFRFRILFKAVTGRCRFQQVAGGLVEPYRVNFEPVPHIGNPVGRFRQLYLMGHSRYVQIQVCHGCTSFPCVSSFSAGGVSSALKS